MTTAVQILSTAAGQIGYKESPFGSNKTKYNRWFYGSDKAAPWCAIFVCWVFGQNNAKSLMPGGKYTASCPAMGDYVIASGRKVSRSSGKPGDIVLYDFDGDKSSDHVGIIEKKNGDGSYTCIEGNTSAGNNGNGGTVMRKTRYRSQIYHVFRPAYTASPAASSGASDSGAKNVLTVDGYWGKKTTAASQKLLKTVQDGIVSSQPVTCKRYLLNCSAESWKFVSSKALGSAMVRALQKLVDAAEDGKCGNRTVSALQKFLRKHELYKGKIDGYMGILTVKAWQSYVNSKLR